MQFVFATHNLHKLKEVQQLLPQHIQLLSLTDIGCFEEIPETESTLIGNAKLKADYVTKKYGYNCFADDTGLEVEALEGAPGVYSARYAGEHADSDENMKKLLINLDNIVNRTAQFKTVIALNFNEERRIFEGVCKGRILYSKQGNEGFGYDPIFQPKGFDLSFAQMTLAEKGTISHRGRAVAQLVKFLAKL